MIYKLVYLFSFFFLLKTRWWKDDTFQRLGDADLIKRQQIYENIVMTLVTNMLGIESKQHLGELNHSDNRYNYSMYPATLERVSAEKGKSQYVL